MKQNPCKKTSKTSMFLDIPSPIPYSSRNYSPGINKSYQGLKQKSRQYKSPQSTPTTSPMPSKTISMDDFSQYFSEKSNRTRESSSFLKQTILNQEKRIQLLERENKLMFQNKIPNNFEKELAKKDEAIRKLENHLQYYKEIASEKAENDKLLDTLVEKDNKILKYEQEILEYQQKNEEYKGLIQELRQENLKLTEKTKLNSHFLNKEECEILLRQIQDLEVSLELQAIETKKLKDENFKFKNENSVGSTMYFSQDINKIKREMNKLVRLLEDIQQGKEICLKGLLGIEQEWKLNPVQQLTSDLQSIKSDLNSVFNIISDLHAEQYANFVCKNQ